MEPLSEFFLCGYFAVALGFSRFLTKVVNVLNCGCRAERSTL